MRTVMRAVGAVLVAIGAFGAFVARDDRGAAAQAPAIFQLSARADAFGQEFIATGFPVVPEGKLTYVSPSSSQATIDQFSSSAFASAPYPGEFVVSLPTTINGLSAGALPPFPAFPFYVATNNSVTPDAREELGPYAITAHSDDVTSVAEARLGLSTVSPLVGSMTSRADVRRDPDTDVMVAEAISEIAPFKVNEVLSVGTIRSTVRLTFDPNKPDAGLTKETSTSVGTITIAGIEVGLTDKGLSLAGKVLLPIDLSVLTDLLAPTGFSLEYVPTEETATSLSSAAVALTYRGSFPAPFLDTTVRFVLGRASATLTTGSVPRGPTTIPAIVAPPALNTPIASAPAALPSGGGAVTAAPPASDAAAPPAAQTAPAPATVPVRAPLADFTWFYPVLAGGALLALSSSRAVQWLSFRSRLSVSS